MFGTSTEISTQKFPGGPVVKTQYLHCCGLGGLGSVPGRGTKILQVVWHGKNKTNKWKTIYCGFTLWRIGAPPRNGYCKCFSTTSISQTFFLAYKEVYQKFSHNQWSNYTSPWDSKIKLVNLKGNQPWILFGRTDAETPVLWPTDVKSRLTWKDPGAGKDWRQEKGVTEDETVGWHLRFNTYEFEQTLGDSEGHGSQACCSPWGCKESDMT